VSRRDRHKKQGKLGRDWAPLYENVLTTEAVKTLEPACFKIYIVACALCKPWLNGAVPFSRKVLRESFGVLSSDTISRAIAELIKRGLIVRTREARPRHAALYGVTHLPLKLEAMKKAGIGTTQSDERTETDKSTPSNMQSEFSDRPSDRMLSDHRTELTQNGDYSDRPSDRIRPFSTSNSDRPSVPSKILPGPPGPAGGWDGKL
jgi:hypothetical protein